MCFRSLALSVSLCGVGCAPQPLPVEAGLEALIRFSCPQPELRHSQGAFETAVYQHASPSVPYMWGASVAVFDADGDGVLDLVSQHEQGSRLRLGWKERFELAPEGVPIESTGFGFGAVAADIDADGRLDLYIARAGQPDRLLLNQGGSFVDVSEDSGIDLAPWVSSGASFGDIDGDDDLDLLVLGFGYAVGPDSEAFESHPSRLYLNDGFGQFEDVSDRLPDHAHLGFTLAGGLHDLDRDGDLDVYLVNDLGQRFVPNQLLWNDGAGRFAAADDGSGAHLAVAGMGLAVGDFSGDGWPDLLVPDWGDVKVLLSGGERRWFEAGGALGVSGSIPDNEVAWGGRFADLDLDGDLDALVSFGHLVSGESLPNPVSQPDRVFLQQDGRFVEAAAQLGLDHTEITRGIAVADLNRDGWLDVVKSGQRRGTGVFLSRCGEGSSLEVALSQTGLNPFGIGARVVVTADGLRQERTVRAGGVGFGAGEPPEVHFGLGAADWVDLEVHWPDGEVQRHASVQAGALIRITRVD